MFVQTNDQNEKYPNKPFSFTEPISNSFIFPNMDLSFFVPYSCVYNQYISFKNKFKRQMSIHEILMSKCELCSRQNIELKIVFKQLYRQFKQILSSQQSPFSTDTESTMEMEGFMQLLRVINIGKSQKSKRKSLCKHPRFLKMMQKSLNCNLTTLNYLCEITANKLAEKNYGLSLIESQFKNIGERVVCPDASLIAPPTSTSQIKKEEPQIASMSSLSLERQIQGVNEKSVGGLGITQTTIEQIGFDLLSNQYGFYYQLPFFYGKQE